ncbi:MAG: isoprenylcysteine carboxylmethyltransferase family protein [Acidobacteria bacterium]|nr:isoprenylcysteine carboxylmethyltransferase family protein [Acidobacteriota bacterium]
MYFESLPQLTGTISAVAVASAWIVTVVVIFKGRPRSTRPDTARIPTSWLGLGLQCAAYLTVWLWPRQEFSTRDERPFLYLSADVAAILFGLAAVFFAAFAIKALGEHFSLAARLIEGHRLITAGVYRIVRHPIYTAMLFLVIAAGLAFKTLPSLILSVIVYLLGTAIRIRSEEKLLSAAFGPEFTAWKKKVPALIPFFWF